jgi:hypothetical protein
MGKELRNAEASLGKAIGQESVRAWGRPTKEGLYEPVPNEQFRIPGGPLGVDVTGDMVSVHPNHPYTGPRWYSIEFEPEEIKRVWPKPPLASAMDWMRQAAKRLKAEGRKEKRETLVQDCVKATECTTRDAIKAYQSLPENVRLGRGKPRKRPE